MLVRNTTEAGVGGVTKRILGMRETFLFFEGKDGCVAGESAGDFLGALRVWSVPGLVRRAALRNIPRQEMVRDGIDLQASPQSRSETD
jgi:hypothetical protein